MAWQVPPAFMNPPLMAVGDSMLNGMQSYTINTGFARRSIPDLLAQAMGEVGAGFRGAEYPAPGTILLDIDAFLRSLSSPRLLTLPGELLLRLPGVIRDVKQNVAAWMARFAAGEGGTLAFDNIAISGAECDHVFFHPVREDDLQLSVMAPIIAKSPFITQWSGVLPAGSARAGQRWSVGDLHIALNLRHLHNPGNVPEIGEMTGIELVAARQPRVLVVNLGPNHGLIDITLAGQDARGLAGLEFYAETLWPECAAKLAALPAEVGTIVVTLMPIPSLVPNMMPRFTLGMADEPKPPAGELLFDDYVPALAVPPDAAVHYTRAEMVELDAAVESVRQRVAASTRAAFERAGRAAPVIYDHVSGLRRHDSKHGRAPAVSFPPPPRTRVYTSYAFGRKDDGSVRGGLASLDNHHPSSLGYRLMAREIAALVGPGVMPELPEITDADDEALLLDPPRNVMRLMEQLWQTRTGPEPDVFGAGSAGLPGGLGGPLGQILSLNPISRR